MSAKFRKAKISPAGLSKSIPLFLINTRSAFSLPSIVYDMRIPHFQEGLTHKTLTFGTRRELLSSSRLPSWASPVSASHSPPLFCFKIKKTQRNSQPPILLHNKLGASMCHQDVVFSGAKAVNGEGGNFESTNERTCDEFFDYYEGTIYLTYSLESFFFEEPSPNDDESIFIAADT
jgi:hypothetical protein